jgi:hypothetical protein
LYQCWTHLFLVSNTLTMRLWRFDPVSVFLVRFALRANAELRENCVGLRTADRHPLSQLLVFFLIAIRHCHRRIWAVVFFLQTGIYLRVTGSSLTSSRTARQAAAVNAVFIPPFQVRGQVL